MSATTFSSIGLFTQRFLAKLHAGPTQQLSLFPETETVAPSTSSLLGLQIAMSSPCGCGSNVVTVGASKAMHENSIRCVCGLHRGWISRRDAEFLRTEISKLGKRPTTPLKI